MLLPEEVKKILNTLLENRFQAFLVGGCVRDLILKRKPKDWDITTNARPEEIINLFPSLSFYENRFGTVAIKTNSKDETLKIIEVTTFRKEGKYLDFRRPQEVEFTYNLETDLKRRDFTINALAMDIKGKIIDLFGGLDDLKAKIIKTVGNPEERFREMH